MEKYFIALAIVVEIAILYSYLFLEMKLIAFLSLTFAMMCLIAMQIILKNGKKKTQGSD